MKVLLLFLLAGSIASVASGQSTSSGPSGFVLSVNAGGYNSKDETGTTVNNDTQASTTDGTLGYMFSSGIYIGGIYGTSTIKKQGAATKPVMTQSGVTLGYMARGWIFHAHHFTNAEIEKFSATANRIDGSGTQFDIGYVMSLFGPIYLGAQISSRTLEYKKLDTAGVETLSDHKVTDLFPAIRITAIW